MESTARVWPWVNSPIWWPGRPKLERTSPLALSRILTCSAPPSSTYMYFCSRSGEKPIHHVVPQLSGRLFPLLIEMLFLKFPILSKTWIRSPCRSHTYTRLSLPMTTQCTTCMNAQPLSSSAAIDTTTPAGRMMMQMVGAFAEFERAMLRERTSAGLAAARAEGRVGGRRKKLDASKRKEIAESVTSGRKSGADGAALQHQPTDRVTH